MLKVNTKLKIALIFVILIVVIMPMVSAKPPVTTEFVGDRNLVIEANAMPYYKINEGASIFIHVFNKSNGVQLTGADVSCEVELTDGNGTLLLAGNPTYIDDYWFMSRPANIITERGKYAVMIHCNSSALAGFKTFFFQANGFGDELDIAHSIKFNSAMLLMMILFLLALGGIMGIDNPIGKFTCYWISHILFIVGTFSMWQFNEGYTIQYLGMAGAWKVMFYFSIIAFFPMIILSIAGMIIYYATDKKVMNLIEKGMPEEEARRRQGRKYK